jgi:hypothetical protein
MQQLDIFADSASVQRANDLIAALANADPIASRQAMQRLLEADPHHADLAQFNVLIEFVDHWQACCKNPGWLSSELALAAEAELIHDLLVPVARIMGNDGDALLRKCWLILAKASERIAIAPEHPDLHAAELNLLARQFAEVVRTAQKIPGAARRAAVQRWLSLGFYGGGKTEHGRKAVLRFAWLAPQRFNDLVVEIGDTQLSKDWDSFQADLGDLDADWFPAWCAHEKKSGVSMLDNLPDSEGAMAYRLVMGLAIRERGGLCRSVYEDRASLKRLNESFFAFYMLRRSDLFERK